MAYQSSTLLDTEWTVARSATATIAADNTSLTDANIPAAQAIDCQGLESIWVMVAITGGTGPTMTLEALFRDANAADGSKWVRSRDASGVLKTAALAVGQAHELTVDGWPSVFLRIDAVANATSTTAWKILVRPGKRRRGKPTPR
jgi:hypothetical protein